MMMVTHTIWKGYVKVVLSTIRIKLSKGVVRELKNVSYVPQLKKKLMSIGALKVLGLRGTWRRRSQDIQWLIGYSEGHSTQQLILFEE